MTSRSPRNKTLSLSISEKREILKRSKHVDFQAKESDLKNSIIHQDLFDVIKFLPDNFVDLMVVDPPYNLTKIYGNTKFNKAKKENYVDWFESWINEVRRCLKPNASLYVCSDWQTSSLIQPILAKHFNIRNRITWEREKGRGAKSNWKNCSEDVWFCTVSDDYYFDVDAVKLRKKVIAPYRNKEGDPKDWEQTEDGNFRSTYPSNLWTDITLPFWSMPENTDHPTQKPEKLIAKLILASSKIGDLVFDPFMGSGTTCVVAKKLDRKYLGIERESDYCAFALKRLEEATRNAAIQGYSQGYFWERNSLSEQNLTNKAKSRSGDQSEIHFEI
jgi:site-specific DNA-methyltransferase (adenine-specific)